MPEYLELTVNSFIITCKFICKIFKIEEAIMSGVGYDGLD